VGGLKKILEILVNIMTAVSSRLSLKYMEAVKERI